MTIQTLTRVAKDLRVAGATGMRTQELIVQILKAQTELSGFVFSEGVLEVLPDGVGLLRAPDDNYLPGPYGDSYRGRPEAGDVEAEPITRAAERSCRESHRGTRVGDSAVWLKASVSGPAQPEIGEDPRDISGHQR